MDANELRKQLEAIGKEEYQKIIDSCGEITQDPETGDTGINIKAYSVLNTPLVRIKYWYGDDGGGYGFDFLDIGSTKCLQSEFEVDKFPDYFFRLIKKPILLKKTTINNKKRK